MARVFYPGLGFRARSMDDAETYTAPWTAAFPFNRDDEYLQFEYACHEGNYSVPNALGGARMEEAGR